MGVNYQLPDGNLDRTPDIGDMRDAGALDAAPGADALPGGADAAPFQDTGETADMETGG